MSSTTGTEPGPRRIALLGNVANCLVPVALALREAGITADLFVDDGAPQVATPENARPELRDAPWVRRGPWFPWWSALAPWRSPVVRALRSYDAVVVSGPGAMYAQFSGRPYGWWVSGHDLTAAPFPWAFRATYRSWSRRLAAFPLGAWQRRALRRARAVWVQPFAPFEEAIARLHLGSPPVRAEYLPLIVEGMAEPAPAAPDPALTPLLARMAAADLTVFHPSRMMLRSTPTTRRSGQWKGNDRLFEGVAELARRRPDVSVLVVVIDASMSPEVAAAQARIAQLGLAESVAWARPAGGASFSRPQMRELYAACDVVAVEFAAGWFGNVALEGLAMGRPVVSHLDAGAMARLYPAGHPMVSAGTTDEIASALEGLLDPVRRAELGEAGVAWVRRHHTLDAAGPRYVAAISATLGPGQGDEPLHP